MTAAVCAFVAAAFWLAVALRLVALRRGAPRLPAPAPDPPPTTILLPVRDEERNVADCVATLLAQRDAPLRVVDDGSTDATPRILDAIASGEPRLEVMRGEPLRPGLSGKVNALRTGFGGIASDWVLLTDADTRHAPDLLARAHAAAAREKLDALSLAGQEDAFGIGEGLLTPPAYALLDLLLGDWAPYARGEGEAAVANGQYFLVRSDALRAIGGFEALAGDPMDDVALARALRGVGFRVGFRRAGAALRVRMYRGGRASFHGWRRLFALLFGHAPGVVVAVAIAAAATASILVALAAARALPLFALAWGGGVVASAAIRRSSGNPAVPGFLFPLDALALAAVVVTGWADRRRGRLAAWRGRALEG